MTVKTKNHKTGKYAKRLQKLADFLKQLPEEKFDLSSITDLEKCEYKVEFVEKHMLEPNCGATACAIGWMPKVFPQLVEWKPDSSFDDSDLKVVLRGGSYISDFSVADEVFNLTGSESFYLFDPGYYPRAKKEQTAKKVAARIEQFIKTGIPKNHELYRG